MEELESGIKRSLLFKIDEIDSNEKKLNNYQKAI
jgi:hypothetical protein